MIVYFIFLFVSVMWMLMLFAGPYLQKFYGMHDFFIKTYYLIFNLTCHQKPERSYFVWGYQMPICVRCFGIYLGIIFGLLIYPLFRKLDSTVIPKTKYLWFILTPIIIDGLSQIIHLYSSPHYLRLATGILASAGLIFYAMPLFNQLSNNIKKRFKSE